MVTIKIEKVQTDTKLMKKEGIVFTCTVSFTNALGKEAVYTKKASSGGYPMKTYFAAAQRAAQLVQSLEDTEML